MAKKTYISNKLTPIEKAAYAVIDAHNHLWGNWQVDKIIKTMNETGVVQYCDLTANVKIEFAGGGYTIQPGSIHDFFRYAADKFPGRFYCFTMSGFAHPANKPLFTDSGAFVREFIETLRDHVELGAKGLKVLKELGLHYRDSEGNIIFCDDERLFPIWEEAARLKIPILIHQSDPTGFFEAVGAENEHRESLTKYPGWSFADPKFPRKAVLLKRQENLIRLHPNTTFILPHFANSENIPYVSGLLDENPNVYLDFAARIDELGRQPYSAREFFIKYQDRIIFGADMPADIESSVEMYRTYFRFLETYDEGFYSPDYDGTFEQARWTICGIGLPGNVLKKIYHENVMKLIPSLQI
jgi:predicted TIM-barrel fold metal-dependent hydrolase